MAELIDGVKDVTEFLGDALEACKDHSLIEAIAQSAPWWINGLAEGLAESLPVVGFLAKHAAKYFEPDQEAQGRMACTLAYQRSIEQALLSLRQEIPDTKSKLKKAARRTVKGQKSGSVSMADFSLDAKALSHPFVTTSDAAVREFAKSVGLKDGLTNRLITAIHGLFLSNLAVILSHPQTEEKFQNFAKLAKFAVEGQRGRKALALHNQYTLWRYERARVLGDEGFGLAHVYTETDCGKLLWREIAGPAGKQSHSPEAAARKNPFSEMDAERTPLLKTVLDLIGTKKFREPIVIQGIAGVGKSSFTLRLAAELMQQGFVPLRIELGDVNVTRSVEESLPLALRYSHPQFPTDGWDPELTAEDFKALLGSQESIAYGAEGNKVSPYVLILDGWDEIQTGATTGFRDDIEKMLNEVRSEFFGNTHRNEPQVHVIITGRPTVDVTKTKLLHDETPFLTVRPFSPEQLTTAIERFLAARRHAPLPTVSTEELEEGCEQLSPTGRKLAERSPKWFDSVLKDYRENFDAMVKLHDLGQVDAELSGTMAVLGLPLLAQLALRLMARLDSADDIQQLVESPCTLYRALIDMTHEQGGKAVNADLDADGRHRIAGGKLRPLLWDVARAITAMGGEEISREELKLRLSWDHLEDALDLEDEIDEATRDNVLSRLVISFFLKEGKHQGCRFLHKSFREYLFAEGVVEQLKDYGRDKRVAAAYLKRPGLGLDERTTYWKDFADDDPRKPLVDGLAETWATTWVTREIQQYLRELLAWEIGRADAPETRRPWSGRATEPLTMEQWGFVRDGMADVWDWWAEGVPLRCAPIKTERGTKDLGVPSIVRLMKLCSPLDPDLWKGRETPDVVRITTVDSRLGDAFCLLAAAVHGEMIERQGRSEANTLSCDEDDRVRRYQSVESVNNATAIRFSPTGEDGRYFKNFVARINAAGWRPLESFPMGAVLALADLQGTTLPLVECDGTDLSMANLEGANLYAAYLVDANLRSANLRGAYLRRANLSRADLRGANLSGADLSEALFDATDLRGAILSGAQVIASQLDSASIDDTTQLPDNVGTDEVEEK